jgi:ribosomal protein S12 methylthiotransferase accessory factor
LDVSLERLTRLVSEYTGVVHRVAEVSSSPDDPPMVEFVAELPELNPGVEESRSVRYTGASGVHRGATLAATLGEAAERYSLQFVPSDAVEFGSASELGERCVDTAGFALFSEDQYRRADFPFQPFTKDSRILWTRAISLPSGAEALVPAQIAYLYDTRLNPGEDPISYSTTNGAACGASRDEALLAALFEVAERDALMLAWHRELIAPLVVPDDTESRDLEHEFFGGVSCHHDVIDLTGVMGIPTALALVWGGEFDLVAVAAGAGAGPTLRVAWRKALCEAYRARRFTRQNLGGSSVNTSDPHTIRDFVDHAIYYAEPANAAAARFLASSSKVTPISSAPGLSASSVPDMVDEVVELICRQGGEVLAVDATSADVRDAGISIMRAIVPQFCGISAVYGWEFLGSSRLLDPDVCDHFASGRAPGTLNLLPHPYP